MLFARAYLSWDAREPVARQRALAPFLDAEMDPDLGMQPPSAGSQHVEWAEVVQDRESAHGEHVYTVAAQSDSAGLLYLTVDVARRAGGALTLAGYPALVGPPAHAAAGAFDEGGREVTDPALRAVLRRALRNYLAGSRSELAADLTDSAQVSLPTLALSLQAVSQLRWAAGGGAAIAVVQAGDSRAAQYTLAYRLDLAQTQGRWEVSAIQTNPQT